MTSTIESLCHNLERQARLPWEENLAGPQRVWFAVYPPAHERRLRLQLSTFEAAAKSAGKGWKHLDLTSAFAEWMAGHEEREAYFRDPDALGLGLKRFEPAVAAHVRAALESDDASTRTIVALSGLASLFGLARVSQLVADVAPAIRGRLLVFFPGHKENDLYKLLDATTGYNYLAIAITPEGDN